MSAGRSPWRVARRAVLTPIAAVAIFAGSSMAAAASAPGVSQAATLKVSAPGVTTAPTMSLEGVATEKTANGVSWNYIVGWDDSGGTSADLELALDRSVTTGGTGEEVHFWTIPVTTSTLAFDATTGVGTLNVGTQASPLGNVDLSFKSSSNKKGTCTTGSETIYSGTLSGEASLVTGLKAGGTVGGTSVSFTVGTPELVVDSACVVPATVNPCLASTSFISTLTLGKTIAANLNESLAGTTGNSTEVARSTNLTTPTGSMRVDAADVDTPAATYDATTKVLTVTTTTSGLVTGTATLSGGKVTVEPPESCSFGGKKYTTTDTVDETAKYASPAGKSIKAKTSLTGTLTAGKSSNGLYDVETSKAA
jgi:hypothetical protein